MKQASRRVPLMIIFGGILGIFLVFFGLWAWRMRPMSEVVVPVVLNPMPSASSTVPEVTETELLYFIWDDKLYYGRKGELLVPDVRKAGFISSVCPESKLMFDREIEGKIFFVESCAIGQIGGPLWMYDPSTLRFTRRKLVPGILSVAVSPDGRYDVSLVDTGTENEARQLIVRDLLRDTETRVASLPKKWSYSASVSEFIGAPIGNGRWEDGKFVVSVYDVSTRLPYAGEEGDIRPVLFEKTITLP